MREATKQTLARGVVAGLIGYAAVVVMFLVLSVASGRHPLYLAALIGSLLFYGVRDVAEVSVWAGPVLAYNGAHLLMFLVLGALASWLAAESERGPQFWYLAAFVLIFVLLHAYGMSLWVTEPVLGGALNWWLLLTGAVAAAAMTIYLWRVHPQLRRQLRRYEDRPD